VHHFLVKTKEFASKIKFVVVTQETFDSGKLNDSIISLSVKCHLKFPCRNDRIIQCIDIFKNNLH
jgi:hypothetical protein